MKDYVWWVSVGKCDWRVPNRLLQTGESVNQAKVFRAHAVPQGLCENLINALKLLANKQEDGTLNRVLLQTSVTGAGKVSRRV